MKKTFVIQVEYPDNDVIPSEEIMEVTQECIEDHLEKHFVANIMDGDYDRIKVKEVTDGFTLVKKMRDAQKNFYKDKPIVGGKVAYANMRNKEAMVDNWLEKICNMKIGTMKFYKGSIINGVPIEEMTNAEKGAFIASQENKGRKVIIEGYNDNDETEE